MKPALGEERPTPESLCVVCGKGEIGQIGGCGWFGDGNGGFAHEECGHTREKREERACQGCGDKRMVKVRYSPVTKRESFRRTCAACEALESAVRHRDAAERLEKKARTLYAAARKRRGAR